MADAKYMPGPLDPVLAVARRHIQDAIIEHCGTGADMERCAGDAAVKILGDIVREAIHRHTNCKPGPWKRMPPELRAAIAKATGGADHQGALK